MTRVIECQCGHQFNQPPNLETTSCSKCGSEEITVRMVFSENISENFKEALKGKLIETSLPSKKKVRKEFFIGADKRRSDGEWIKSE